MEGMRHLWLVHTVYLSMFYIILFAIFIRFLFAMTVLCCSHTVSTLERGLYVVALSLSHNGFILTGLVHGEHAVYKVYSKTESMIFQIFKLPD